VFVSRGASILHADLDSFFASVEQRDDPRLLGRPVIVGMGVVLAASYEAKAYGVRTAMGEKQARGLCPQAVVVRPRMSAYSEASKAVFRVFEDTSPLVEGLSIDEAFLDVGGMERSVGSPVEIAAQLRHDVRDRVGRMRTAGRTGRTVVLRLRFDDYSRATRSHTLPYATASTERILATARTLLATALPTLEARGITLVGVAVANLDDALTMQLALPLDSHENDALDAVVDLVRSRFGTAAITRAVLLGRSPGLTMPLLPD